MVNLTVKRKFVDWNLELPKLVGEKQWFVKYAVRAVYIWKGRKLCCIFRVELIRTIWIHSMKKLSTGEQRIHWLNTTLKCSSWPDGRDCFSFASVLEIQPLIYPKRWCDRTEWFENRSNNLNFLWFTSTPNLQEMNLYVKNLSRPILQVSFVITKMTEFTYHLAKQKYGCFPPYSFSKNLTGNLIRSNTLLYSC